MKKKHTRIYVSPRAKFADSSTYEYVAEFESEKLANYYMRYLRHKQKYPVKDIILQEVSIRETEAGELSIKGDIICICAVSGEYLRPEEWLG